MLRRVNKKERLDCLLTLPNSIVHHVSLPDDSTGYDCLEKICSILGIVESDYFGLRYIDHHGIYLWLNNRMKLTTQIKASPPLQLHLRVKYFVDPKVLQQPSTSHIFYLQIKSLMFKGQLPVMNKDAGRIGALLAQAEIGDLSGQAGQLCYPKFFKDWNPGVAREISRHHATLKRMTKQQAERKLLSDAFQLENWGVSYLKVINMEDNSPAYIGIGGFHIRLCNAQWKMVRKISYACLLQASFRNKTFVISYRSLNSEGQQVDKRILLKCQHHRVARYMFRLLTEDHTFFTHETVNERVRDHIHQRRWQFVCERYLGRTFDHSYHFDVLRTQHESYARIWELLHQVNQNDLHASLSQNVTQRQNTVINDREREIIPYSNSQHGIIETETIPDSTLPSSSLTPHLTDVDLVRFGLSKSSCDIAKELLKEAQTEEQSFLKNDGNLEAIETKNSSRQRSDSVCLTKEGTEKLGKFIQKIVDSKLCRICMDNPVSAVFCPCGHHMTCYQCATECTKCPLCRKEVAYVQYVYGTSS